MNVVLKTVNWVTICRAAELTGRSEQSFNGLVQSGLLVEGKHWKWSPDNRRHFNLEEYDKWVETSNSKGSTRGNRRSSSASSGKAAATANA